MFIARGLSKVYGTGDARVFALKDIDLDIRQGEFLVLLGPSGSGKSTLLNILGGLDAPTSGTATWRDHELTGASDAELTTYRREHVGFVVPVLQPDPQPDRPGERAARRPDRQQPDAARRGAGACRAVTSSRSLPIAAFGRRAAAGRGCARHRQASRHPAVRRADRRARLQTPVASFLRRSPRSMPSLARPLSSSRTTLPLRGWPPECSG